MTGHIEHFESAPKTLQDLSKEITHTETRKELNQLIALSGHILSKLNSTDSKLSKSELLEKIATITSEWRKLIRNDLTQNTTGVGPDNRVFTNIQRLKLSHGFQEILSKVKIYVENQKKETQGWLSWGANVGASLVVAVASKTASVADSCTRGSFSKVTQVASSVASGVASAASGVAKAVAPESFTTWVKKLNSGVNVTFDDILESIGKWEEFIKRSDQDILVTVEPASLPDKPQPSPAVTIAITPSNIQIPTLKADVSVQLADENTDTPQRKKEKAVTRELFQSLETQQAELQAEAVRVKNSPQPTLKDRLLKPYVDSAAKELIREFSPGEFYNGKTFSELYKENSVRDFFKEEVRSNLNTLLDDRNVGRIGAVSLKSIGNVVQAVKGKPVDTEAMFKDIQKLEQNQPGQSPNVAQAANVKDYKERVAKSAVAFAARLSFKPGKLGAFDKFCQWFKSLFVKGSVAKQLKIEIDDLKLDLKIKSEDLKSKKSITSTDNKFSKVFQETISLIKMKSKISERHLMFLCKTAISEMEGTKKTSTNFSSEDREIIKLIKEAIAEVKKISLDNQISAPRILSLFKKAISSDKQDPNLMSIFKDLIMNSVSQNTDIRDFLLENLNIKKMVEEFDDRADLIYYYILDKVIAEMDKILDQDHNPKIKTADHSPKDPSIPDINREINSFTELAQAHVKERSKLNEQPVVHYALNAAFEPVFSIIRERDNSIAFNDTKKEINTQLAAWRKWVND